MNHFDSAQIVFSTNHLERRTKSMKHIKQLTKITLLSAAMAGLFAQTVHAEELKEEIITKNETVVIQPTNPSTEKGYPVDVYKPDTSTKGKRVEVTYVATHAGDTIRLKRMDGSTAVVRLLSVNVPETRGFYSLANKQIALKAETFVENKLKKAKKIELVYDSEKGKIKEPYIKRTVAHVYVDGEDLGKLLLYKGYAHVTNAFGGSKQVLTEYKAVQNKAKAKNKGMWKTSTK